MRASLITFTFTFTFALALPSRAQPAAETAAGTAAATADEELLDADDPRAKEGVVVGARGIDPGWKDSRVAERSPSLYGQTGLLRSISARTGKTGYFDLGLHGRWFYFSDFIRPGVVDDDAFFGGQMSFGVTAFDFLELAVATQFATNANNSSVPKTLFTTGDLLPSAKVGYAFLPFAVGLDMRAVVPTAQDQVGLDARNFAVTATGLFTYDLYEQGELPLRAHANLGYTYQNARFSGDVAEYLIPGVEGALLALTTQSWFYDQLGFAVGVEAPFPYVTPFLELSSQTAIGVGAGQGPGGRDYGLGDSVFIVTPGVRGTVGRGLSFDLALDVGLGGNAGGFSPDVNQLAVGQPYNPLWAVQMGISYTFSPFVAETQVEVREKSRPQGLVEGCVTSDGGTIVRDAVVEYAGMAGPRILVDERGCFRSPPVDVGGLTIRVTHPDYKPAEASAEVRADETSRLDVTMAPSPRLGHFKGAVANEDDEAVEARVEVSIGGKVATTVKSTGGTFDTALAPGRYQAVVKADGYLQQGLAFTVEPLGKTIANFVLKKEPTKRLTKVTSEKIEISSKIPFEFGKARLLKAAEFVLDDVVDVLLQHPELVIRVEGHTDNTGEEAKNVALSDQRAAAVVEYLVAHGVPATRLKARGYGFSKPVADNDTEEGRAKNRRVEFVIAGADDAGGTP